MSYHPSTIMLVLRALEMMKKLAVDVGLGSFDSRVMIERQSIGNRLRMPGIVKLLEGASVHTVMAGTADAWIEITRTRLIPLAVGGEELRRYKWMLCRHNS